MLIEWKHEQFKYPEGMDWEEKLRHSPPFMVREATLVPGRGRFTAYAFSILDNEFDPESQSTHAEACVYLQRAQLEDDEIPDPELLGLLTYGGDMDDEDANIQWGDNGFDEDDIQRKARIRNNNWVEDDTLLQPGDVIYIAVGAMSGEPPHTTKGGDLSQSAASLYLSLFFPPARDAGNAPSS